MKINYEFVGLTDNQIKFIRYRRDYYIKEYRKKYLAGIDGSAMFHKRVRLEKIEKLFEDADKIEDVKDKVSFKLKCLGNAQSEAEGKTSSIHLNQYNQFNYSPEEIRKRLNDLKKELKVSLKHEEVIETNAVQ